MKLCTNDNGKEATGRHHRMRSRLISGDREFSLKHVLLEVMGEFLC